MVRPAALARQRLRRAGKAGQESSPSPSPPETEERAGVGPAGRKGSQDVSYAYTTAPWHDFFVCAGGSAAALLGLLFVALSFHLDRVAGHQIWRSRVWAATMELLTALV